MERVYGQQLAVEWAKEARTLCEHSALPAAAAGGEFVEVERPTSVNVGAVEERVHWAGDGRGDGRMPSEDAKREEGRGGGRERERERERERLTCALE